MSNKLDIGTEMRAFDLKDRNFYDSLTADEKKKFSTYLMLKWGANVEGEYELQEWYLRAHNERVNINFFDLGKHPKLQWLLCTTTSPGMGAKRHYWIKTKKDNDHTNHRRACKFLENEFPHLSPKEIELMAQINTIDQLRALARDLGWDDKKIKSEL